METGSDTAYASSAYYGILMPGLTDEDELLKLDLLSSILSAQSSPLSRKMQTALPYAGLSCYLELAGPDPIMVFSADSINAGDEIVFRETVDSVLEEIAANGISRELADAVMNSRLLSSRLRREGANVGVNVIAYLAYNDVLYDDPWSALVLEDYEEKILEWSEDGTFTKLVADYLAGDQTHVLTMTNPQPGAKEEKDAALAAKLEEVKKGMSEEEKAEIIEASNAADEMDDASAYVRELQGVDVDTLPEEIPAYDITDETDETGIRRVQTKAQVSGVGIVEILLDASGLSVEQLRWMRLLTELQNFLDSETHTRDELAILQDQYFYNGSVSYTILQGEDKLTPYYTMSWISLTDCLQEGYDLAYELAFEQALDADHYQQVLDALQALVADRKNAITQTPYSVTLYKGLARGSEIAALSDSVGNLNYYQFLQDTLAAFAEDPASVMENLAAIRDLLGSRSGAIAVYAGDEESFAENRLLSDEFFERLEDSAQEAAVYEYGDYPDSYAMIVDSSVYYNGYAADYETLGLDGYNAGLTVTTSLVTDQFLYPLLRDQYGAYGVFNSADEDMGFYMLSYRDPNLEETYAVYEQLPELLRSYPMDQEIINGYILSAYSQVALSAGELSGALSALNDHLNGKDPMRKLEWMQQLKAVTPETIMEESALYEKLVTEGVRISAGASGEIRENSDLFEVIEAPFEAAEEAVSEEIAEAETEAEMDEAA
ncbi:MAG: hypothetical protein IJI24_09295 [Lachnospiraceae bacterium]|nr:hypothetical protein [Lachnospiraceae bacterium]